MRREFGELIYLGLFYVVIPYQSDLETVTKVVIYYSDRGGWGLGLGLPPLCCLPWNLQSLHFSIHIYVRIHTCVYLIVPILVFICCRRINIYPCYENNSIERRAGETCDRKNIMCQIYGGRLLNWCPPHQRVTIKSLGGTWFQAHKFSTLVTYVF